MLYCRLEEQVCGILDTTAGGDSGGEPHLPAILPPIPQPACKVLYAPMLLLGIPVLVDFLLACPA